MTNSRNMAVVCILLDLLIDGDNQENQETEENKETLPFVQAATPDLMTQKIRRSKRVQSGYNAFLTDFFADEANNSMKFVEKSQAAAKKWKSMSTNIKNTYVAKGNCDELFKHYSKDVEKYICSSCGLHFKHRPQLKYHEKHECGKQLECSLCKKIVKSVSTLQRHLRTVHQKQYNFICSTCNTAFSCTADLKTHENIHFGIKFICKTCGGTYSNKSNLLRHGKKQNHVV